MAIHRLAHDSVTRRNEWSTSFRFAAPLLSQTAELIAEQARQLAAFIFQSDFSPTARREGPAGPSAWVCSHCCFGEMAADHFRRNGGNETAQSAGLYFRFLKPSLPLRKTAKRIFETEVVVVVGVVGGY